MIRVSGLTKDFGVRRALDSVTFHADQGEVVGFLGPNGAGKTTTMRILCGYMSPTDGEAMVAGYDVVEDSLEVRRRVGYLPETVPLYNDMTVTEFLTFMAELRHLSGANKRTAEVLEIVGMTERARGYIGNLSKGMRQRIGLAQALLHRPEVLILDEPTIGLDPGQVVEVRSLISDLGKLRTVLLSTHVLSEAQQVCDRVLIINKGRIVAEDSPENLQARLAGSERAVVHVRGDGEGLAKLVRRIKGIEHVLTRADGVVEFEFPPGRDPRPQVAKAVVEEGFDLLELRPIGLSLEEIFLELTTTQKSTAGKRR